MGSFSVGQRVDVRGEPGTVRFFGPAQFAPGEWVGVELDQPHGRNDGSVQDVRYFTCQKSGNYGVFVRSEFLHSSGNAQSGSGPNVRAVVNKLQVKLKAAVEELGHSKETIETLQKELETDRKIREQLETSLEQSAVDLEYVKAHNTDLVRSLDSLREKYDHLSADFSIVNEELELHKELEKAVGSSAPSGPVSVEDFQILLSHNKKLELALTSLRKVADEAQNSRAETLLLFNEKVKELAVVGESHETLSQKLSASEAVISQLHEELEVSAESNQIIDYLTSENELLQAKIADLTQSVKELTELHEMDKSIEENHAIVENEYKALVDELKGEISSHKKQLGKLQTANQMLLKERGEVKQKLQGDSTVNGQEYENLILEVKKLKLQGSTSAFTRAMLHNNVESLADLHGQLVPENYKDQIATIASLKRRISSCSALLVQVQKLPISSAKTQACYTLSRLQYALTFLEVLAEYAHSSPPNERKELEEVVSRLENLDRVFSQYVPDDIHSLDLSSMREVIEMTEDLSGKIVVLSSAKAEYVYACMNCEIAVSLDIAQHMLTTYFSSSGFDSVRKSLAEFKTGAKRLMGKISQQRTKIQAKADQDLSDDLSFSLKDLSVFSVLASLFKDLESEIGLDDRDLAEKFGTVAHEFPRFKEQFSALEDELSKTPKFNERERSSVYRILRGIPHEDSDHHSKATSVLETQLMEKTQKIQDLYLQIDLLEKNMGSAIAGKDTELQQTKDRLSRAREEYDQLKLQTDDLLSANKDLSAQLDALRSVDHFSEFQQIPVFENLKAMREYTKTMAMVDEINLLKKMVRTRASMPSRGTDENWLSVPLARRRRAPDNEGIRFLQDAQKKRKEAWLVSRAILGNGV